MTPCGIFEILHAAILPKSKFKWTEGKQERKQLPKMGKSE